MIHFFPAPFKILSKTTERRELEENLTTLLV